MSFSHPLVGSDKAIGSEPLVLIRRGVWWGVMCWRIKAALAASEDILLKEAKAAIRSSVGVLDDQVTVPAHLRDEAPWLLEVNYAGAAVVRGARGLPAAGTGQRPAGLGLGAPAHPAPAGGASYISAHGSSSWPPSSIDSSFDLRLWMSSRAANSGTESFAALAMRPVSRLLSPRAL